MALSHGVSGRIVAAVVNVSDPAVGIGNTPKVCFDFTRHLTITRSRFFIKIDRDKKKKKRKQNVRIQKMFFERDTSSGVEKLFFFF
jgi:hypothetical protein